MLLVNAEAFASDILNCIVLGVAFVLARLVLGLVRIRSIVGMCCLYRRRVLSQDDPRLTVAPVLKPLDDFIFL